MINKYLKKNYINNYSDILSYSKDKEFNDIINKLDKNKYITVTSNLIHKENKINQIEQFIFNLDNYITFIKDKIFINQLELRYIINLTLYNKYNKILYSSLYYYDNIEKFNNEFINIFMYNYKKNYKILSKYSTIKEKNFDELVDNINTNKKRISVYFENISKNNISFYLPIYESLNKK